MATLSESTPVKLGLMMTVVLLVVGAVVQFTRTQTAVDRHTEDISELKKAKEDSSAKSIQQDLRLQRLEDNYANIMTGLGELKSGVDELKRKK